MAQGVRADLRAREARHRGRRTAHVLQQDESSPMAAQSCAPSVLEQWLRVVGRSGMRGEESPNETGRLRQNWAESFATTLPADADVRWGVEAKVARRQIEDLLNASAGVVQHGQEDVIAFTVNTGPVHLRKDMSELLLAQVEPSAD